MYKFGGLIVSFNRVDSNVERYITKEYAKAVGIKRDGFTYLEECIFPNEIELKLYIERLKNESRIKHQSNQLNFYPIYAQKERFSAKERYLHQRRLQLRRLFNQKILSFPLQQRETA